MENNPFLIQFNGYDPSKESLRETLCTLGNGYFATRGAHESCRADSIHYPGTYLAGGYNRLKSEIKGQVIENEDLVNWPNWLFMTFRIDGGNWFYPDRVHILSFHRLLICPVEFYTAPADSVILRITLPALKAAVLYIWIYLIWQLFSGN